MKVNQIVTEHKKGVRAMKYAKKTKGTVPLYGPGKQEAKLTPVKPVSPVKEDAPIGVVSAVSPDGKEVTIKKTDGSELKTTGSAVMPGADGKTAQLAPQAGGGLKPGTPVTNSEAPVSEEVPVAATAEVDPGVEILDIAATPEAKAFIDANTVRDAEGDVDFAGSLGQMMAKASAEMDIKGLQAALAEMEVSFKAFPSSPEFQAMSPEDQVDWKQKAPEGMQAMRDLAAQFAKLQQTIASGGQQMTDLSKTADYQKNNPMKGVRSLTPQSIAPVQESADDKLLKNMLSIAGVGASATSKPQVKESADITAMLRIAGLR